MAVLGTYCPNGVLSLRGGMEAGAAGTWAATMGWQSALPAGQVRLLFINRMLWRRFAVWRLDEFSSHVGVGAEWRGWRVHLGVAERMVTPTGIDWLNESTTYVFEPFNLMYELCYRLLLGSDGRWMLVLRVADFDDFVTDRAYQPLFSASAVWRLAPGIELAARGLLHPTGMLSMSANYYEAAFNLGMKWLW